MSGELVSISVSSAAEFLIQMEAASLLCLLETRFMPDLLWFLPLLTSGCAMPGLAPAVLDLATAVVAVELLALEAVSVCLALLFWQGTPELQVTTA